jgi:hypothetical protein
MHLFTSVRKREGEEKKIDRETEKKGDKYGEEEGMGDGRGKKITEME